MIGIVNAIRSLTIGRRRRQRRRRQRTTPIPKPPLLRTTTATTTTRKQRRTSWNDHDDPRVLILGLGSSGKTVLFRQMSVQSWTSLDLQSMRTVIHGIIVIAIKTLVQAATTLAESHPQLQTDLTTSTSLARSAQFVADVLNYDDVLSHRAARHIGRLWASSAIRRTYSMRLQLQVSVPDSTAYFLSRIGAIADPKYVPSHQDCLYGTVRSTGIQESLMQFDDVNVQLLDLGGRRHERSKWHRVLTDQVVTIIYVVSVGDFDARLDEDPNTLKIHESLTVFERLMASPMTDRVAIVLVFTKVDLLEAALNRTRITDLFPSYHADPYDCNKVIAFFKAQFMARCRRAAGQQQHVTTMQCCTVDRQSTPATIRAIRSIIARRVAPDAQTVRSL